MNRKRHTTILALSAAAMAAMLGLMAAGLPSPDPAAVQAVGWAPAPAQPPVAAPAPPAAGAEDALAAIGALAAAAAIRGVSAALEHRADAMEGTAIGVASGAVDDRASEHADSSGRARAKRRAIAMPYFSFAQGLRGTRS